jgi:RNA polymerase sigma-70 factor (ECF subfamily)
MTAIATEMPGRIPFEEIYVQHRKYVYLVCYRVLRNEGDAEEVMQDTFLKVLKYLHTFTGESSITTWLHRIAVNEAIRRKRKSHDDVSLDEAKTGQEGDEHFLEIAAPDHTLEMVLLFVDLERGMRSFPPEQREMLSMRIHDCSYAEIAEVMGASLAAVRANIHKGRKALRKTLSYPRHSRDGAEVEAAG